MFECLTPAAADICTPAATAELINGELHPFAIFK